MNTKNNPLVLLWQSVCMLCGTFPFQLLLLKIRDSSLSLNGDSHFCTGAGREGISDEMAEQAAAAPSTGSISQCHMSGSWTNNAPLSTLTELGVWPCEAAEHWGLRNCAHTHTGTLCGASLRPSGRAAGRQVKTNPSWRSSLEFTVLPFLLLGVIITIL